MLLQLFQHIVREDKKLLVGGGGGVCGKASFFAGIGNLIGKGICLLADFIVQPAFKQP